MLMGKDRDLNLSQVYKLVSTHTHTHTHTLNYKTTKTMKKQVQRYFLLVALFMSLLAVKVQAQNSTFTASTTTVCSGLPVTFTGNTACSSISQSLSLAGTGTTSTSLVLSSTSNFTLEGWIKPNSASGTTSIFYNNGFGLILRGTEIDGIIPGIAFLGSSANVTVGIWQHIALVNNASTWTIYLNGTAYTTNPTNTSPNNQNNGTYIGCNETNGEIFDGNISQVAFWNTVRTTSQILTDMQVCSFSGSGLAAYWSLNGNTSDLSGNGYNLSVSNTTYTTDAPPILPSGGAQYAFDFGDGSTYTTNVGTAIHTYNTANTYSVSLTATYNNSANTTTHSVTVNPSPTASISGPTAACGSATLTASGGTSYIWTSGSSLNTASTTISTTSTPSVTVSNSYGCSATASQTVTITDTTVAGNVSANQTIQAGSAGSGTTTIIGETNTSGSSNIRLYGSRSISQSFTPSMNATLSSVAISVSSFINGSFTLKLLSGSGNGGTVLSTQSVTTSSTGVQTFSLPSSISLTSGSTYTLMLSASSSTSIYFHYSTSNPYANGMMYNNGTPNSNYDLYFALNYTVPNVNWNDLTLTGNTGNVLNWQQSANSDFTNPTTITNTSTTLPSYSIGNLTATTFFRAVVQSGSCAVLNTNTVSVTVVKNTPSISAAPTASDITYGQTLASSTLSGGIASVAGTFAFTTPSTAPSAGTASQGYTFTPTDATNYNTVTGTVSVTVNPKVLSAVGTLVFPASKVYDGTTTATATSGSAALQTSEAAGTGSSSDGIPYIGDAVSLTGTAAYNYNSATVASATTITASGLSLNGAQASNYSLTAPIFASTITARSLTITANNANKTYGTTQSSPVTGSTAFGATGLQNSETIGRVTLTYGIGALTPTSAVGNTSTITPSAATGGSFSASNYSISYTANSGTLTVVAGSTGNWLGIASSDFSNAANWANDAVQSTSAAISVPSGTTYAPVLTANTTVASLHIASGATLGLGGYTLTLNGAFSDSGSLSGSSTSGLIIGDSAGTINFTTAYDTLQTFTLTTNATATLGTKLNIVAGTSPGTVAIGSGAALTTDGNLSLLSDANGTARIDQTAGAISGNITVQRYITAKPTREFSFIGSPVTASIRNAWQQQIYITGPGTGGTPCGSTTGDGGSTDKYNSNGFDVTLANKPSLFTYGATKVNGSHYVSVSNTDNNTNLTPGIGYTVNIRGNRNSGTVTCANQLETSTPTAPEAVTLSATGTVTTGDLTVSLYDTTQSKFTLLANPYPCQISFSAFHTDNSTCLLYTSPSPRD